MRPAVRAVRVVVAQGADAGRAGPWQSTETLTVGTSSGCDVVLTDPHVSRYHFEVTRTPAGIFVHDLGSLNGTHYQGARIDAAWVPPGATLEAGRSQVRLEDAGESARSDPDPEAIPGLVGTSAAMRAVTRLTHSLAASSVSVLLHGETGTGKELVARAIHELGPRRAAPFVVVDCGALSATLIAAELFGHERGAFTGADQRRIGAFERASGGTVFLDEIGELPLGVQPMLLGVLERRRFRRVGGEAEIAVDVRVISATHRDLRAEANRNTFRADLYYRLAATRIVLPPLRERPEDVELLARHFLREATGDDGSVTLSPATLEALAAQRWPGNVRELRNVVEAAVATGLEPALATGAPASTPGGTGSSSTRQRSYGEARREALDAFERSFLSDLNARTGGNASEAARLARMDRAYLLGLLRKHGLR